VSRRAPRLEHPSFDVERQISRGKLKRLYDLLVVKHRSSGSADPAGHARLDIERILEAAFGKLAAHYHGRKKSALDRLVHLQKEVLGFYQHALAGGEPDVGHLEKLLKDMDKNFRELAKKADDLATELGPLERVEVYNPKTKRTTVHYGGGAEAGGATYVVEASGATVEATVTIEGPHPGREKGALPDPAGGLVPGEHRGHMGPEGGVADPRVTNVVENLISEAARSNLSPKKKFDNLVSKVAAALPGRVKTRSTPIRSRRGVLRPDSMLHEIVVDGKVLYKVTIPNV
jgi:hypothetical protein